MSPPYFDLVIWFKAIQGFLFFFLPGTFQEAPWKDQNTVKDLKKNKIIFPEFVGGKKKL